MKSTALCHAPVLASFGVSAAFALVAPAFGQSNVAPSAKSSWGENVGWMNWRDAGAVPGGQGARLDIAVGYLEGFVWGENIGWINLGQGGPYTNTNNTNFGVNVNPCSGELSGFAWGENVGWINFAGGRLATPGNAGNHARFDFTDRRLYGLAWGENIGWVNLNIANDRNGKFVGMILPGDLCDCIDFNRDDVFPSNDDINDFLNVFSGGPCSNDPNCGDIDFNNDGVFPSNDDIEAFLRVFSGGPC